LNPNSKKNLENQYCGWLYKIYHHRKMIYLRHY
jgi:hypothetical protein